jgi:hypothetical protein
MSRDPQSFLIGRARPRERRAYVDAVIAGKLLGWAQRNAHDPWIETEPPRPLSPWLRVYRRKRKAREVGV